VTLRPHVMVMDIRIPDQNGIEAIFGPGVALTLIADGQPNGVVATRLGLSPKTVSNHMSAAPAKLGVAGCAEAAGWAPPRGPSAASGAQGSQQQVGQVVGDLL
jgi:DNA-binding NarL/FixJ family response regulator